jgi:inner membrane protein
MDTLTHSLLGAVTCQLGFRQRIGRDATWVAAAAALTPDLDIFVTPLLTLTGTEVDGMSSLWVHRGLSHSLLLVPVLALPIAGIWWWARRSLRRRESPHVEHKTTARPPPSFALLYLCILTVILLHPLLDLFTSYGTQVFSPITHERFAIDAIPIIDIIYTPLLVLTLIACFTARKVTGSPAPRATLLIGWTGFLLSVGYIGAGRAMHDLAVAKGEELAGGARIARADAYPTIGTIFLWRVVVETEDQWIVARVRPLGGNIRRQSAPKVDDAWVRRARELHEAKMFDWFAMGRVRATSVQRDGTHVVEFLDMRYGTRPDSIDSMWSLRVVFDEPGRLMKAERVAMHRHGNLSKTIGDAWREIWEP